MTKDISPELLRRLLRYDPDSGKLFWLERAAEFFPNKRACSVWNARYAGREALTTPLRGYLYGRLFNRSLSAHRAALAIVHGVWPQHVDHINGNRADNRQANLRDVTRTENNRNAKRPKNNRSGHVGVCWDRHIGRWKATIGIGGKSRFIGNFDDISAAISARRAAETEHGYHANHGRVA